MKRKILASTFALLVVLFTSGCMKLTMNLTVHEDNTVDGYTIVAYSPAAESFTGARLSTLLDANRIYTDKSNLSITPWENDQYVGSKVIYKRVPLDLFQTGTTSEPLSITRSGSIIKVSGYLDLTSSGLAAESGNPEDIFTNSQMDSNEISVAIALPGKVSSSTGQVSGNTVTFKGKVGEKLVIEAQGDLNPSPLPDIIMLVSMILIIGLGAWFAIWFTNRKKAAKENSLEA